MDEGMIESGNGNESPGVMTTIPIVLRFPSQRVSLVLYRGTGNPSPLIREVWETYKKLPLENRPVFTRFLLEHHPTLFSLMTLYLVENLS